MSASLPEKPLIEISGLTVEFASDEGAIHAVRDAGFSIPRARTVGLVGESGCGKSTAALALLGLVPPPGKIAGGRIVLQRAGGEVDLAALGPDAIRPIRGKEIAMVFQEPGTAFTPVYTIGQQIVEMVRLHLGLDAAAARARAIAMLESVGIQAPAQRVDDYPHELSGGMRQRAMIAMALSCNPSLLIADEPTASLDVTVQAGILELLRAEQARTGMSILLVSHDLGVIAEIADEVVVMYAGEVVERGSADTIFHDPQHPYTRGLLRSIPVPRPARSREPLYTIPGSVPDPRHLPQGCPFHPRCPEKFDRCLEPPKLLAFAGSTSGHDVRCWARQGAA